MANRKPFWILVLAGLCLSGCAESGYNRYADDFYNQGIAWYQKGEYDRAVSDFTKVLEMAPEGMDNYVIFYNRGLAHYKNREYDQAILDFDTALKLVWGRTSSGKYNPGVNDSVMDVSTPTPKLEYGVFNIYKARGDAWFYEKGYNEAMSDYNNALKYGDQRKERATVYNSLGWVYFNTGDYQGAINSFSAALEMNPHSARDFYGRAITWTEIGNMKMALRNAVAAQELKPNNKQYDDLVFALRQSMKE